MSPHTLPTPLARTFRELHGARGAAWIERFPRLVAHCEQAWGITIHVPFPNLSYHFVAPATARDGRAWVFKAAPPHPEQRTEIAALRLYAGQGAARLRAVAPTYGALLIERLQPGAPLSTVEDDAAATLVAAGVMRQLWRPLPNNHSFPTVARWATGLKRLRARFDGGVGPLPRSLVEQAERYFEDLLASAAPAVLLHGDLHHGNILSARRAAWLAIDPKGVAGEPAYEVGALLRNPLPQIAARPDLPSLLARRVAIVADALALDPQRLAAWGLAQAVLAAWWSIEDHGGGGEAALACAAALAKRLP